MKKSFIFFLSLFLLLCSVPSLATVTVETNKVQYSCNGTTTVYAYTFRILENDDLLAKVTSSAGVESTLTLNTDYTVTGAGTSTGGNLTLTAGSKCPSGYTLTLLRNTEITQETDYVDGEAFSAESLEGAIDKMTMILQQQQEQIDRERESTITVTTIDTYSYVSEYANLNNAISGLGAGKILVCDSATSLTSNTAIPAGVALDARNGCMITTTGYTLAFTGSLEAGRYQIFTGTGTISGLKEAYPEWWYSGGGWETAFNSAMSASSNITLSGVQYDFNAGMTWTDVNVVGVPGATILRPSASVTGTFLNIYNHTEWKSISGLRIVGTDCPTATGIVIASNDPLIFSDRVHLSDVSVYYFKKGIVINLAVLTTLDRCTFRGNGSNEISNDAAVYQIPNMTTINNCAFMESSATLGTGIGLYVTFGNGINITNTEFESNDKEGLKIKTSNTNWGHVELVLGDGNWFENNQNSESHPENFYNIVVDGSLTRASIPSIDFTMRSNFFHIGPVYAKIAHLIKVDNLVIEPFQTLPYAVVVDQNLFKFEDNCHGKISLNRSFGLWRQNIELVGWNWLEAEGIGIEVLTGTDRAVNSSTPDINIGSSFVTQNTTPTTITQFTGTWTNKRFTVTFGDDNTTVKFSNNVLLSGNGNVDWKPTLGDRMECVGDSYSWGLGQVGGFQCTVIPHTTPIAGLIRLGATGTSPIEADASTTIAIGVPAGSRLLGTQFSVDSALATGELWDAAYSGGSTTTLATGQAVALGTKVNAMHVDEISSGSTNIVITKNGGGSFTAQGTISAVVYYEKFATQADTAIVIPPVADVEPTATAVDDFNRANESPLTATNWYGNPWTLWSTYPLKVVSNAAQGTSGGYSGAIWKNISAADMEVVLPLTVLPPSGSYIVLLARHVWADHTGYEAEFNMTSSTTMSVKFCRWDNGGAGIVYIGNPWNGFDVGTVAAGDLVGFQVIGSTLYAWVYHGGVWRKVAQTTDATHSAAGLAGFGVYEGTTTGSFTDFRALSLD